MVSVVPMVAVVSVVCVFTIRSYRLHCLFAVVCEAVMARVSVYLSLGCSRSLHIYQYLCGCCDTVMKM